jgi:DNA-binding transcriptional MocR family regulator
LRRGSWTPDPDQILFTGNGRQALAAALSALAAPGDRVGIEAFSYPVAKSIAARLGVVLVPIALDEDGIRPDAIVQAHRDYGLKGVYIQPALHNPLGITMGPERRAGIAATLVGQQLIAIEDAVYSFLVEDPPLAALAPDHVILIDSLSKRLAPGTTLGFAVAPGALVERVARGIRAGGWNAQGLAFVAAIGWVENGTASAVASAKREDARQRQAIAAAALAGLAVRCDPRSYHVWLALPEPWRADTFCAAAARLGIAISPSGAFAIQPGHAPAAVRIALAAPPLEVLRRALEMLAGLARSDGDMLVE